MKTQKIVPLIVKGKHLLYPKGLISICCLVGMLLSARASLAQNTDSINLLSRSKSGVFKKNNVKINLSSLAFNSYSFYYERSLSRKISFTAGYRTGASTTIGNMPLVKNAAQSYLDGDLINDLNQISISNNAFTGEFRFYGGKHPGARGIYLSLYGRYTDMKVNYDYEYQTSNRTYNIPLKNNLNGFGAGLMIGRQLLIAKRITLDMYILGGHYGKLKGSGNAVVDLNSMTATERQDLKSDLESIVEIGNKKYMSVTVDDQNVTTRLDGPFLGVRGLGFSLGMSF